MTQTQQGAPYGAPCCPHPRCSFTPARRCIFPPALTLTFVPGNGGTITLGAGTALAKIIPTNPLTSLTVTLPVPTRDNLVIDFQCRRRVGDRMGGSDGAQRPDLVRGELVVQPQMGRDARDVRSMIRAALAVALALAPVAADASGIYGTWLTTQPDQPSPDLPAYTAVLANPRVVGITINSTWAALEPANGTYAWTSLDDWIARAAAAGKQVILDVQAGEGSPGWVNAGSATYSYKWIHTFGQSLCSTATIPLPWDAFFQASWATFATAFGAHYAGNPAVVGVKLTGVSSDTAEVFLRFDTPGQTTFVCGGPHDASLADWVTAGYTPTNVLAAWQGGTTNLPGGGHATIPGVLAAWKAAFPTQRVLMQIIFSGLPPIDDSGVIGTALGDFPTYLSFLLAAVSVFGQQFVFQSDGLSSFFSYLPQTSAPQFASATLAYQAGAPVTDEATCRMNNHVMPCGVFSVLNAMINRAEAARAVLIEFYQGDLLNNNAQVQGLFATYNALSVCY
jgi:Beta-galactosidase